MAIVYYYVRDFFAFIGGLISALIDLIQKVLDVVIEGATFIKDLALSLPTMFYVFFIALVAISVIYKILGREGATD